LFERKAQKLYIALNKPRGYVSTLSDELDRRCITDLVSDLPTRVYPIGRLDKDSEGLLLLTNDGDFANLIMHPRHHISKTYRLTVRPDVTEEQLITLSTGVKLDDDSITAPAQVQVESKEPGRVVLRITIFEGKNRQIRRMCEALGLEVARLRRVSVGPIRLGMLQPGKWRELTPAEVGAVRGAVLVDPEPAKPKPDRPRYRRTVRKPATK
ncbi:MAG: pseudouridine synthase, partial [Oscillospiraceae bacterium]